MRGKGPPLVYYFADCALDMARRELRRGGVLRPVEPQVLDLLLFLIDNRGHVATRDEIFETVWRGRIVSDSVLSTRINAVRSAIGDSGAEQRLIRTVHGRGFRFIGELLNQSVRREILPSQALRTIPPIQGAPAVVVAPFGVIGHDACDKAFADGLTEEIITALARIGWFSVVVRQIEMSSEPVCITQNAGRNGSGAAYALGGLVHRIGERIRISVRLLGAGTNDLAWAERYDGNAGDAFALQDDIAGKVASALGSQLYAAESRRAKLKSRQSLAVWDCIVRALSLINTRQRHHVATARVLLRRAVAIDPKCAAAHGLLSFVVTLGVHLGWDSRQLMKPIALKAARRALALDEEESWGHVALGYATLQVLNDPEQATAAFGRALELDQNLAVAHYFDALALSYIGRIEDAFFHADEAERLQSFDLLSRGNAGAHDNVRATVCFVAGRYQDGVAFARRALAQSPRQVPAYRQLVINGAFSGETRQAADALGIVRRFAPRVQRWLQESQAMWGHRDDYRKYSEAFRMAGLR
jgi:TolB-like protein/Tfp pilus assembly protein PilF